MDHFSSSHSPTKRPYENATDSLSPIEDPQNSLIQRLRIYASHPHSINNSAGGASKSSSEQLNSTNTLSAIRPQLFSHHHTLEESRLDSTRKVPTPTFQPDNKWASSSRRNDSLPAVSYPTDNRNRQGLPGAGNSDTKGQNSPRANKQRQILEHRHRPFQCDVCGKQFVKKDHAMKHWKVVHLKIRPHHCKLCGSQFGQRSDLNKHFESVHLGKKPFECRYCGKKFAHRGNLTRHEGTVHQNSS